MATPLLRHGEPTEQQSGNINLLGTRNTRLGRWMWHPMGKLPPREHVPEPMDTETSEWAQVSGLLGNPEHANAYVDSDIRCVYMLSPATPFKPEACRSSLRVRRYPWGALWMSDTSCPTACFL